jgi:hypothetical protein
MKTAVEWYNEQLNLYGDMAFNKEISLGQYHIKKQELLKQAKEMFEDQIIEAWVDGVINWDSEKESQQYYNETFKSE